MDGWFVVNAEPEAIVFQRFRNQVFLPFSTLTAAFCISCIQPKLFLHECMYNFDLDSWEDVWACMYKSGVYTHIVPWPCCWLVLPFQELERSWREYDRLGAEVTLAKSNLLEQLEALGSPQVTPTNTHKHTVACPSLLGTLHWLRFISWRLTLTITTTCLTLT